jgi:hypothetical protein
MLKEERSIGSSVYLTSALSITVSIFIPMTKHAIYQPEELE